MSKQVIKAALEAMCCVRDMVAHPDNLAFIDKHISALQAALAEPEQEPVAWVPVTEALPESGVKVLACYRNRFGNLCRIRAKWIAAKTDEAYDEGAEFCSEYDEATDTYYTTEGWYECINNWDEFTSIAVTEGDVTHWMPLPPDPDTAPTPRKPLTDEEIVQVLGSVRESITGNVFLAFARAVIAAYEAKNGIAGEEAA